MITRLHIRNYRSHKESRYTLEPLTIFIGPVASGKSNIFKALMLLQSTIHRKPEEYFGSGPWGFAYQRTRSARTTEAIEFEVEVAGLPGFPEETARYQIEMAEGPAGIFIAHERLERFGGENGNQPGQLVFDRSLKGGSLGQFGYFQPDSPTVLYHAFRTSEPAPADETIRFCRALATSLSSIGYFHLELSSVRRRSGEYPVERIGYTGDSIPSFLLGLRQSPEKNRFYDIIADELKELLPNTLREIRLVPTERGDIGVAFDFEGYKGFLIAPEQSDGTLLSLAFLCVVHQPARPKILCIEEPENGLHPRRLRWLYEKLVSLAYPEDDGPPVQVLVSTHSPYLVDFLKDNPASIRIVRADKNGYSTVEGVNPDDIASDVALGHQWYMGMFGEA